MGMTGTERKLLLEIGRTLSLSKPTSGLLKAIDAYEKEDQRRAQAKEQAPQTLEEQRAEQKEFLRIQRMGDETL